MSTGNYPYLKIYFDGGSRGNPGPSAVGVVIYDDKDKKIEESGEFIGEYTNNIAEYSALKKALELAKKYDCKKIMLFTDSKLLNNQIQKIWKIKDPAILKMYVEISRELAGYDVVDIRLIPRSKNSEADKLVNKALDKKELTYDGESKINFGKLSD